MKMNEFLKKIMITFEGSFINYNNELILIPKYNIYFMLDNVENDDDLKRKLIEFVSREACKGLHYKQKSKNIKYQNEVLTKINLLLETSFSKEDIIIIYTYLGNGIKTTLAKEFVASGFDMDLLKSLIKNRRKSK